MAISATERETLRRLAAQVRAIADDPSMPARKQRWRDHNALRGERPMVLCFPEGAWNELLPDTGLTCQDRQARNWECQLRRKIYWWENLRDDNTIEPFLDVRWHVNTGDYGVSIPKTHGDNRGSYVWDPPIKDLDADFPRLCMRRPTVDREGTWAEMQTADQVFGDLLPPRLRGYFWWTMGLTLTAVYLIGLEQLMLAMYDNPRGLHRLMAFLRDDHLNLIDWVQREGLLTPTNGNEYTGSGGVAYTDKLPGEPVAGQKHIRLADIWGFAESQETVGVSPEMFGEFVLPYQLPLLDKFGLNCYGCCEGLEHRFDLVRKHVPRLRRVSVAPLANQDKLAAQLGGDFIFSRKPDPVKVCVGFDEAGVRRDLRHTLALAGHLHLEVIMKDTHTVQNEPWRLSRWVKIAFEEVEAYMSKR